MNASTKSVKKPLKKLPRRRTAASPDVTNSAMPTEADAAALSRAALTEEANVDSIAANLRRSLGIKPEPVKSLVVDDAFFSKTVVEGMLGADAPVVLNSVFASDPELLPSIVSKFGDLTQVKTQVAVICEMGRAMYGADKTEAFCKKLLKEPKFHGYYAANPEVAQALKGKRPEAGKNDPKFGADLADKFLAAKSDAIGFNPDAPILPLARNISELARGKDVVIDKYGNVTMDGKPFNWYANHAARIRNSDGVRWFQEQYGELFNSKLVTDMRETGSDGADLAANALAWPFAVAGEGLANLSVVIQDKSGKAIRFVGNGLLSVVLGGVVLAKGTAWLVRQAADWIATIGKKAYKAMLSYATGVIEWLFGAVNNVFGGVASALHSIGVPAPLVRAGFLVAAATSIVALPALGGVYAVSLGMPMLVGELAGLATGAAAIGTCWGALDEAELTGKGPLGEGQGGALHRDADQESSYRKSRARQRIAAAAAN